MLALPILAVAFIVAFDVFLVRALRASVLHAFGVADARLLGPEPPFEVKLRARLVLGVAALVAGYVASGTLVALGFAAVGEMHPTTTVRVLPGGAAAVAGMHDGDRIESIGYEPIEEFDDIARTVAAHAGKPVTITVMRHGRELEMDVTPGPPGGPAAGKIGVAPVMTRGSVEPWELVKVGVAWPLRQWGALGEVAGAGGEPRPVMSPVAMTRALALAPPPDAAWTLGFGLMLAGAYEAWAMVLLAPLAFWSASRREGRVGARADEAPTG